ncbi:hypothetical protein DRQ25_12440 [Candidatus Fermentibacteria bacterium]|nr:MAG: hypothetical protein DRQ25_12440 [Candidatus Fermentibacteria bacterium]
MLMYGILGVLGLLVVGMFVQQMSLVGTSSSDDSSSTVFQKTCDAGFSTDFALSSNDYYKKSEAVSNVTYSVWKVTSENTRIAQADAVSSLTISNGETYEIVAQADNRLSEIRTVGVSDCVVSDAGEPFYLKAVPSFLDTTVENSKIIGYNSLANPIPTLPELTRTAKFTFVAEAKSYADALIVYDFDKTEFDVDSDLASTSVPDAHTTLAGYKSQAYSLGAMEGSQDVLTNLDVLADENLVAGNYTVEYTIYMFQTGYIDGDDNMWVGEPSVEDEDDNVLLSTETGTVYFTME